MIEHSEAAAYLAAYNEHHGTSFRLGGKIASGGTASVFDLEDTVPAQVVKIMKTTVLCSANALPTLRRRSCRRMYDHFSEEMKAMHLLQGNPHIMPILGEYVHHLKDEGDLPEEKRSWEAVFLIRMPKLMNLSGYLKDHPATEQMLIQLGSDICRCLVQCEASDILHRDVKPPNIFVREDADGIAFVLGDFGVCRRSTKPMLSTLTRVMTVGYTAPEALSNTIKAGEHNADIYSLGSVLYELAGDGTLPHELYERDVFQLPVPDQISGELGQIIVKACAYSAGERYRHAAQMLADLEAISVGQTGPESGGELADRARGAICEGDFDKAAALALQGIQLELPDCRRLWAYCRYVLIRNERMQLLKEGGQAGRLQACEKELEELSLSLDEQILLEDDMAARCIRALIYMEQGDVERFYRDIGEAAEAGHAMARYYHGKALWEGWGRSERDRPEGCRYVLSAAEEGYLPAVDFLRRRLYPMEPEFEMSRSLEKQVVLMEESDPQSLRENMVRFL